MYIGGRLAYWEDINGDRQLRTKGYKATIEDTFGIYTQESTGCVAHVAARCPIQVH